MADLSGNLHYYCHECQRDFIVTNGFGQSCINCNSEFIEELEMDTSERVTEVATPITTATTSIPQMTNSSVSAATATTAAATTAAATTAAATTAAATTSTTTASTSSSRGPPINITIGSNPIFRNMTFPFTAGSGSFQERQDSPMDTDDGEDPGDEVLNPSQLRRRSNSRVRSGGPAQNQSMGIFPGGMFMVSHSARGGANNQRLSLEQMIHQHIESLMAQRDAEEGTDGGEQQQQQQGEGEGGGVASGNGGGGGGVGGNRTRRNIQVINFPSVQVMMGPRVGQAGSSDGGAGGGASNPQLPHFGFFGLPLGPLMGLHGTPRDYAWGPQGLDNIISQMLANLEDNGPPPTEKEKIEGLPIVEVTMEDLHECALCSVCKDDFSVGEKLLKLPCQHLYHKDCVIPWLELHDTCPTCRFHLNTGKYEDDRTST